MLLVLIQCTISSIAQSSFATIVVDYQTLQFEGGYLSYHASPNSLVDSVPLKVSYIAPNDFGGITFTFNKDTIFDAEMVWFGGGQIYFPEILSVDSPFTNSNIKTQMPVNTSYFDRRGEITTNQDFIRTADSAWNIIESYYITHHLNDIGLRVGIYLFEPDPVGRKKNNKWILFLYGDEKVVGLNNPSFPSLKLYPNPTTEKLCVSLANNYQDIKISIVNNEGQLILQKCYHNASSFSIDLSNLNRGLYHLILEADSKKWLERIIVR
jgi:hypothetical protein